MGVDMWGVRGGREIAPEFVNKLVFNLILQRQIFRAPKPLVPTQHQKRPLLAKWISCWDRYAQDPPTLTSAWKTSPLSGELCQPSSSESTGITCAMILRSAQITLTLLPDIHSGPLSQSVASVLEE